MPRLLCCHSRVPAALPVLLLLLLLPALTALAAPAAPAAPAALPALLTLLTLFAIALFAKFDHKFPRALPPQGALVAPHSKAHIKSFPVTLLDPSHLY